MRAEAPTAAEQTAKQQQFPTVNSTRSHAHSCSRLTCHGGEQSGLVTLTFDLLTLKVVSDSQHTQSSPVSLM